MKHKLAAILLFIFQGIPIPFSLVSILGSIISLANIGIASSTVVTVVSFLAMFLAGTYTITYVVSLVITMVQKNVKFYSFLPLIHGAVAGLFLFLWSCL